MTENEQSKHEASEHFPPLEVVCSRCSGKGGHYECDRWISCHFCQGAGHIPTEFGERVLALIRHNLQLDLNQANPPLVGGVKS